MTKDNLKGLVIAKEHVIFINKKEQKEWIIIYNVDQSIVKEKLIISLNNFKN